MAGYSATPLAKKLGIKPGSRVKTSGAPPNYLELLEASPEGVIISSRLRGPVDIWHLFVREKSGLKAKLKKAQTEIPRNGMIWVSWPKKSAALASDLSEDEIRRVALPLGLVDIKVCAVDETWSGLKLVIRISNRNKD